MRYEIVEKLNDEEFKRATGVTRSTFEKMEAVVEQGLRNFGRRTKSWSVNCRDCPSNGVDSQTIINALMDEAQAYFDVAVTAGKLTAEEAAEIVARQVEPATHYVNEPITFDNKGDKNCENGDDEGGDKLAKASVEANAVSDAVTTQPSRTTSSFLPIIT